MHKQITLAKVLNFFLTKIVIAVAVIVGLIAAVESLVRPEFDKTSLSDDAKNLLITMIEVIFSLCGYIFLFRTYEKRPIKELSASTFWENATLGLMIGVLLQSLFIVIIWIFGTYALVHVNSLSVLITPFCFALTAGFVAEILFVGVLFRLIEEQLGTYTALAILILLFALLHINSKGATLLSVCATAIQAGFMLPAAFVFGRSLWLPIFLHFGWDFAEPGIFGGINPGTSIAQGLFTSKITGSALITGSDTGPHNSIQSLILCSLAGILFLLSAKRKNNFIKTKLLLAKKR
jgi:membrane protease YdiL (CAAX protease family)